MKPISLAGSLLLARAMTLGSRSIAVTRSASGPQFPGQRALAAADVERPLAAGRNGRQDQRIVVRVVVPALMSPGHETTSCHRRDERRRDAVRRILPAHPVAA
jgi:hypothetical protein